MDFILVLANIIPKQGCRDSIIDLADELIEDTLAEKGNIEYRLLKSINEPNLTFIEKWKTLDDLKKHMNSTHFKSFSAESEDYIEKMDIQVINADKIEF